MHDSIARAGRILGTLAAVLVALWLCVGAGIYGAPLAGATRWETLQVLGLLALGPLGILPASLVGRKHPREAGLWLLSSSGAVALWLLFVMGPLPQRPTPGMLGLAAFFLALLALPSAVLGFLFIRIPATGSRRGRVVAIALPLLVAVPACVSSVAENLPETTIVVLNESGEPLKGPLITLDNGRSFRTDVVARASRHEVSVRSRPAQVRLEGTLERSASQVRSEWKSSTTLPRTKITFHVLDKGRVNVTTHQGTMPRR